MLFRAYIVGNYSAYERRRELARFTASGSEKGGRRGSACAHSLSFRLYGDRYDD